MLFTRYANPMQLLNQMILTDQLSEWVSGFMEGIDEEKTWEYYMSTLYFNKADSFEDFKARIHEQAGPSEPIESNIEATVKKSQEIMKGFQMK